MKAAAKLIAQPAQSGFTLVELVMTLIIVGILAAMVGPRFSGQHGFEERGFYDEAIAALRYAQKSAVAQRRPVCVTVEEKKLSLSIKNDFGSICGDMTPSSSLSGPDGRTPYTIDATENADDPRYRNADVKFGMVTVNGAATTFPVTLMFLPSGSPASAASLTVSDHPSPIVVEAQTGYVH